MPSRIPLPKICVALGFPELDTLLHNARREAQEGERFLEFRLDYLSDPFAGAEAIGPFLADHPDVTVLATCRRQQNHGYFAGSIETQVKVLEAAITAGAQAVDLEIESAEVVPDTLGTLRTQSMLIVSYHNFETTPAMEAVLRRLMRVPAFAYKLVATARKPSDVSRVLASGKSQQRTKLILLSMGETGFPARVLSPMYGGLYTYAAPSIAEGTAPGQVTAKLLRNVYRVEKIGKATKIFGVIADPVGHSISPAVHNRALQSKRIDAVYLPFRVSLSQVKDFMVAAEALPVQGFSVTIPHKQKVMRYLDYIDPLARRIGAVNTVWKKAGKWRGCNTDVFGITGPLAKRLRLRGASVLIAGNGGAARGAAFSLADAGAKVTLVGRSADKVRALARVAGAESLPFENVGANQFDAVVNATPLGMYPHDEGCFFDGRIPSNLVFDMVYNPLETTLLKRAKAQGAETIPGTEMFLEQAAHQFELFTGDQAPRSVMEKAAFEALGLSH